MSAGWSGGRAATAEPRSGGGDTTRRQRFDRTYEHRVIKEVGIRGQGGSDHQLQQLLLRTLVQVGPLECHQLAGGGVAGHAHQAQVVEAPPCNQKEQRGARSGESLDAAAWGGGV